MSAYRREMEGLEETYESVPDLDLERRGGPQGEDDEEDEEEDTAEEHRKKEEREKKKAEVRKRLEEAGKAKKAKKGFLTPERKKKLRKLLMLKAAEDLKQQQVLKEQERQRILAERIIPLPDVDSMSSQEQLEKLAKSFFERVMQLEAEKYDVYGEVSKLDIEINELTIAVNDLRGKFVKPTLKKVSKYDNKFAKLKAMKKGEGKADFRDNLKKVKVDKWAIKEKKEGEDQPEWKQKKEGDEEAVAYRREKEEKEKHEPIPENEIPATEVAAQ